MLHRANVPARAFGAVGDGVADDTSAITAAISESQANGGSVFFHPGSYKVTSTIDLSGVDNVHLIGGMSPNSPVSFLNQPAVGIVGTSITTGAVFRGNQGGNSSNHTFENLSVQGGRTGFHYTETANIRLRNVGVSVTNTGHADNASILMENSFWAWYENCAFNAPSATTPSVILRGKTPSIDAQASGLQRFQNVNFGAGGVEVQQNLTPNISGNWYFENCILENSQMAMLRIVEGAGLANYHIHGVIFINCEHADAGGGADTPILHVNSSHAIVNSPVFINIQNSQSASGLPVSYILDAGQINSARVMGSNRMAIYGVDGSDVIAGNYLRDKEWGFDLIAKENTDPTHMSLGEGTGAAIRLTPGGAGQSHAQVGISSASSRGITFGAGTADADTNLYRSAADTLKTDDTLNAANIVSGSQTPGAGVGNLNFDNSSGTGTPAAFRLDGFADTLYLIAESQVGGPTATRVVVRTANSAGVAVDRVKVDETGNVIQMSGGTFHEFLENGTTDAAAGAADTGRLYVRDNGAGKTQLCVRFNTGAVQVIATQP